MYTWLCCLNPREFDVTYWTALGLPATLFVGIPVEAWDALWVTETRSATARRLAYLSLFHLEIVTIIVGDPPAPVDVVAPSNLPLWVELCLYIDTTIPLCPDGCEYVKYH